MDIIESVLSFFGIDIYKPTSANLNAPQPLPPKIDPVAFSGGIADPRPEFPNVFTSDVAAHVVGGASDADAFAPVLSQVEAVAAKIGAPALAAGGAALTAGATSGAVTSAAVGAAGTAAVGVGIAADVAAAVLAVDAMLGGQMADNLGRGTNFNEFTPQEISVWQKGNCTVDETNPPCSQIAGAVMHRMALGTKQIIVNGEYVTVGGAAHGLDPTGNLDLPTMSAQQARSLGISSVGLKARAMTSEEFGTFHGDKNAPPQIMPNDDPTDDPDCMNKSQTYNGIPFNLDSLPIEQIAARVAVPTRDLPSAIPMIPPHPTAQPFLLRLLAKPRTARPEEAPTERLDEDLTSTTSRLRTTGTFTRAKQEGE
jgi:hypothetical protein